MSPLTLQKAKPTIKNIKPGEMIWIPFEKQGEHKGENRDDKSWKFIFLPPAEPNNSTKQEGQENPVCLLGQTGPPLEEVNKGLRGGNQLAGAPIEINRQLTIGEKMNPITVVWLNPRGLPEDVTLVRVERMFEVPIQVIKTEETAEKGDEEEPEKRLSKKVGG